MRLIRVRSARHLRSEVEECALIGRFRDLRLTAAVGDGLLRRTATLEAPVCSRASARVAIYHFSAKVISRSSGRSAVAAAAYRSASALLDEREARTHDFSHKADVVHSEILLPDGAPEHWSDRSVLWNAVEASEKRKDAQLAREVEFALPRELSREEGVALARDFVQRELVPRGMMADLNVHWPVDAHGEAKPHAHVMLTMRAAGPEGFGRKVRDWNSVAELQGWRAAWATITNERLVELGHEVRIDHRSFKEQGIDLEPQNKIGPAGMRRAERGEAAERAAEHRAIAQRNGERIAADPDLALNALTQQQATFTRQDLARFVDRHTDGAEQFARVLGKVEASTEIVRLGEDDRGRERFTTRAMLATEERMERGRTPLRSARPQRPLLCAGYGVARLQAWRGAAGRLRACH